MIDPRTKIAHTIEVGQIYKDERTGTRYLVIFLDNKRALLEDQSSGAARLERRREFEAGVGSRRFKLQGEVAVQSKTAPQYQQIDFTKVSGVGQGTATALQKSGYTTAQDIERASDSELLEIRGVGEGNLERIREYIK